MYFEMFSFPKDVEFDMTLTIEWHDFDNANIGVFGSNFHFKILSNLINLILVSN